MIRSIARCFALAAVLTIGAAPIDARIPGHSAPPSPESFLGYPLGADYTTYDGVRDYSRALAAASRLVRYRPYGTTPENRELFQLVIAREDYGDRLEQILADNAELALPATSPERARQIASSNPAVVYFSYGAHGDEASSTEAALWTAWDLARGAPEVDGVLDSAVVVIDPVVNPDGRDRYVHWFRSVVGESPDVDPKAREHREPWPGGRFNHYLFDLNRDWAWATQPETRARLATWVRWNPQVHVDFHEMAVNSSYFFFPAAAPINPIYPTYILEWAERFGAGNARAFDARGWSYFTGDNYDFFYPGYGDTWPSLTGAIGMTYEQAGGGSAGLAIRRASGDTLTLRDRVAHHRTSGEATLRTLAAARTRLLSDFAAGQRSIGQNQPDVLLVPGSDTSRTRALVEHLRREGIEVERADTAVHAPAEAYPGYRNRADFPAGTYRVRARQPRGRLATTLLQPRTPLEGGYSYDISAWSLPYAYGVEAHEVRSAIGGRWSAVPLPGEVPPPSILAPATGHGYLLPPCDAASAAIVRYMRAGGRARILSQTAIAAGRVWPAGSWFLPGGDSTRVRATGAGLGALVTPAAPALAKAMDSGSTRAWPVSLPRVAVLTGAGVAPASYGAHWFFLERELGLPFAPLRAAHLGWIDLSAFQVVVLPDADGQVLDEAGRAALRRWVDAGGRLIAVAGGARIAAPLFDMRLRESARHEISLREQPPATRTERQRWDHPREIRGVVLPVRVDASHPLAWAAGTGDTGGVLQVLHEGDVAFEPGSGERVVAFFPSDLRATSGIIADEDLQHLQRSAWSITKTVGKGSVILFADDPLFRLFWRATQPLYTSALLVGTLEEQG